MDGAIAIYADPGRRLHRAEDGLVEVERDIAGGFICARTVRLDGAVAGALTILADAEPVLSGPARDADITYTPRDGRRCERGMED